MHRSIPSAYGETRLGEVQGWSMTETPLPPAEFASPGPLRDSLIASILSGAKTTTTSLLIEYAVDGRSYRQQVDDRQ